MAARSREHFCVLSSFPRPCSYCIVRWWRGIVRSDVLEVCFTFALLLKYLCMHTMAGFFPCVCSSCFFPQVLVGSWFVPLGRGHRSSYEVLLLPPFIPSTHGHMRVVHVSRVNCFILADSPGPQISSIQSSHSPPKTPYKAKGCTSNYSPAQSVCQERGGSRCGPAKIPILLSH